MIADAAPETTLDDAPAKTVQSGSQYLSERTEPAAIEIVDYDPAWPAQYERLQTRIAAALGTTALSITHVGSTSVPGLPAKPVIDVDIIVADICDESTYVPALEKAGFQFFMREPDFYEHRMFVDYNPQANIHIHSPTSGQVMRHTAFTTWLKNHPEDRNLYAEIKRKASKEAIENSEDVNQYNARKSAVLQQILARAMAAVDKTDKTK